MLVEPRHQLDEIARLVAIIELIDEDVVPGVLARARRPRQAEDIGRPRDARRRPRLDRRGADLLEAHEQEEGRERVHLLLEQRLDRFGRDVAAGEAGAARRDHDVDLGIGDPRLDPAADRADVVGRDRAVGDRVTGRRDALRKGRAGAVVLVRARVGHGEHGDSQRDEFFALVQPGHFHRSCKAAKRGGGSVTDWRRGRCCRRRWFLP